MLLWQNYTDSIFVRLSSTGQNINQSETGIGGPKLSVEWGSRLKNYTKNSTRQHETQKAAQAKHDYKGRI